MNGLRSGGFDRSGLRARFLRSRPPDRRSLARWRSPGAPLLVTLLLVPPGGSAWADDGVYTWKDAAGRAHYSNRRPEGQPVEAVELNAKPVKVRPTERIYTWTDREGKVHYGSEPPAGMTAKELKEDDSSLSTVPSVKPSAAEQDSARALQQRQ
jgi:hypothetical protein